MRICIVGAGNFSHVVPYVESMKIRGHEVYFLALSPTSLGIDFIKSWYGSDAKDKDIVWKKWRYIFSAFKARRIVKRIRPDVVHAHYATSGGIASLIINHPATILTVHGSDVNSNINSLWWKLLFKRIFRQCRFINVVSSELEANICSLGISNEVVKNINVGIDFDKFYYYREQKRGDESPCIISNRAFEPIYDHETLIRAVDILSRRGLNFRLKLLGEGSTRFKMESLVNSLDLNNYVEFVGFVGNIQQIELFKQSKIYVSTSISDGTSLSLLEALANGLYPIVSNINANTSWIENGQNGLLFQIHDYVTLADLLEKIISKTPSVVYDSLIFNQNLVRENGNRRINMEKIENLYKAIIM